MKQNLKVSETITLGPTDVAVVWDEKGETCAFVSDEKLAKNIPPHVYQAFAMMLSRDDSEIMSLMWGKLERKMDEELRSAGLSSKDVGQP